MHSFMFRFRARTLTLLGVCGLALIQTACAHPVAVEPSVVVQARIGGPVYGSVYAPLYGPPPVVVSAPPVWMAPPSPVWVAPSTVVMPPGWMPPRHHHWRGQGLGHGWGRGEGFHR